MATTKPRITITLDKNIYETLTRLANLQGVTRSVVINDLLEAVHTPLMQSVALLEAAQGAPAAIKTGMRESVDSLLAELEAVADQGTGLTRDMISMINQLTAAEGAGDDARSTSAHATSAVEDGAKKGVSRRKSNPRVVTRGSGGDNTLKNNETGISKKGAKNGSI